MNIENYTGQFSDQSLTYSSSDVLGRYNVIRPMSQLKKAFLLQNLKDVKTWSTHFSKNSGLWTFLDLEYHPALLDKFMCWSCWIWGYSRHNLWLSLVSWTETFNHWWSMKIIHGKWLHSLLLTCLLFTNSSNCHHSAISAWHIPPKNWLHFMNSCGFESQWMIGDGVFN